MTEASVHRPQWVLWAPSNLLRTLLKFQEIFVCPGTINLKRKSYNEIRIKCLRKAFAKNLGQVHEFVNLNRTFSPLQVCRHMGEDSISGI